MADVNDSVITVEELIPDGFGGGRRVELRGGALPKVGASWSGKQQVKTRWYVGNPVASRQVLGPQEMPSSWEGMWRRNILGRRPIIYFDGTNTARVVDPIVALQIFDELRVRGHMLRVIWTQKIVTTDGGTTDAQIVREGSLTTVEFPVDRAEDIGWKMTFDWVSRGGQAQRVSVRDAGAIDAVIAFQMAQNAYIAAMLKLQNPIDPSRLGAATQGLISQLSKLADYPKQVLASLGRTVQVNANRLGELVDLVRRGAVLPADFANGVLAIAQNTVAISQQSLNSLGTIPAEYGAVSTRAADVARNASYMADCFQSATQMQLAAFDVVARVVAQQRAQNTRNADGSAVGSPSRGAPVQKLHIVKSGETPQSISMKEYGTPDFAMAILKANHLPFDTIVLTRGTLLVIPAQPATI